MTEQISAHPEQSYTYPRTEQAIGNTAMRQAIEETSSHVLAGENAQGIAETANYMGNWMLAQRERMAQPDFQVKYDAFVQASLSELKPGVPQTVFDKPGRYQSFHERLSDTVPERHDYVYGAVGYGRAEDYHLEPHNTGRGGIGEQGTVFSDASTLAGVPLTGRQKDIIAAHEAYHGMVTTPAPAAKEVARGFDGDVYNSIVEKQKLKQPGYLRNPDELMARMAQLKNYYGMQGSETFTKGHLDYARQHYVADTGLDNSMSVFMQAISSRTEPDFLRLMNTLPV